MSKRVVEMCKFVLFVSGLMESTVLLKFKFKFIFKRLHVKRVSCDRGEH